MPAVNRTIVSRERTAGDSWPGVPHSLHAAALTRSWHGRGDAPRVVLIHTELQWTGGRLTGVVRSWSAPCRAHLRLEDWRCDGGALRTVPHCLQTWTQGPRVLHARQVGCAPAPLARITWKLKAHGMTRKTVPHHAGARRSCARITLLHVLQAGFHHQSALIRRWHSSPSAHGAGATRSTLRPCDRGGRRDEAPQHGTCLPCNNSPPHAWQATY